MVGSRELVVWDSSGRFLCWVLSAGFLLPGLGCWLMKTRCNITQLACPFNLASHQLIPRYHLATLLSSNHHLPFTAAPNVRHHPNPYHALRLFSPHPPHHTQPIPPILGMPDQTAIWLRPPNVTPELTLHARRTPSPLVPKTRDMQRLSHATACCDWCAASPTAELRSCECGAAQCRGTRVRVARWDG